MTGLVVPAVYVALGVLGFVALFQFDSSDDYAGWTLVFAVLHVIWWAAIQRASATPIVARGRRITANVVATALIGCAGGGMLVAVTEALVQHVPALWPVILLALVVVPALMFVCARRVARLLASARPRVAERLVWAVSGEGA